MQVAKAALGITLRVTEISPAHHRVAANPRGMPEGEVAVVRITPKGREAIGASALHET